MPDIRIECTCTARAPCRALYDARGIFVAYVCNFCEEAKKAQYRPDIFTDPTYWTDEPVDESF